MKRFLYNFRDNLGKVIPHLVESQVSLSILQFEVQGVYTGSLAEFKTLGFRT